MTSFGKKLLRLPLEGSLQVLNFLLREIFIRAKSQSAKVGDGAALLPDETGRNRSPEIFFSPFRDLLPPPSPHIRKTGASVWIAELLKTAKGGV